MIGARWQGVDDSIAALVDSAELAASPDAAAKAMLEAARPIVEAMRDRGRGLGLDDTGLMLDSLAAARADDAAEGTAAVELGPRRMAGHSWLVRFHEFGTSRAPARPFIRPGWDEHARTWPAAVTAALRKAFLSGLRRRRAAR